MVVVVAVVGFWLLVFGCCWWLLVVVGGCRWLLVVVVGKPLGSGEVRPSTVRLFLTFYGMCHRLSCPGPKSGREHSSLHSLLGRFSEVILSFSEVRVVGLRSRQELSPTWAQRHSSMS